MEKGMMMPDEDMKAEPAARIEASPAKKRKPNMHEGRAPKKRRANHDIKKYFSCKRWSEEDKDQRDAPPHKTSPEMQDKSEEKAEQSHKLPGGRRLDTTLTVTVPSLEGRDEVEIGQEEHSHILPGGRRHLYIEMA